MRRFWPFGRWQADSKRRDEDMNAALWEADRALKDAKDLRSRADEIGERLRDTGRRNHFGEAVAKALRGETT